MTPFEKARLDKLFDKTSDATRLEDLPGLVELWLRGNPEATKGLFVLEKPEGGTVMLSAQVTLAEANFLLDGAKLDLFLRKDVEP